MHWTTLCSRFARVSLGFSVTVNPIRLFHLLRPSRSTMFYSMSFTFLSRRRVTDQTYLTWEADFSTFLNLCSISSSLFCITFFPASIAASNSSVVGPEFVSISPQKISKAHAKSCTNMATAIIHSWHVSWTKQRLLDLQEPAVLLTCVNNRDGLNSMSTAGQLTCPLKKAERLGVFKSGCYDVDHAARDLILWSVQFSKSHTLSQQVVEACSVKLVASGGALALVTLAKKKKSAWRTGMD